LSEHPLLPHHKLRELYALMLRTRRHCRRSDAKTASPREALLAATVVQLQAGDIICSEPADRALSAITPVELADSKFDLTAAIPTLKNNSRLGLTAALARGLQAAGHKGVAVAFTSTHSPNQGWQEVLAWAVEAKLPLLLVCIDDLRKRRTSTKAKSSHDLPLGWSQMTRVAKRVHIPVFCVDGEDAVASYRVVQETVLRGRSGDGPSVLWAVLGSDSSATTSHIKPLDPVARMRRYMAARSIPLTD
jgi:Dehydrogenase E1 component